MLAMVGLLQFSRMDPLSAGTLFFMLGLVVLGHGLVGQHAWLFYVPALLPVVDLVPYTGVMNVTAADALLLSVALAGYVRVLFFPEQPPWASRRGSRPSLLSVVLILLLAISYGVSTARGLALYPSAGGQFAGYYNHWNVLRIAKGFFLPLLLLPLLVRAVREEGRAALDRFGLGLFLGLMTVTLVGLYERLAYPGLLNFSSDYRITASFWEMNVGGAALDGWLALTLPFAVWAIVRSHRVPSLVLSLSLAGLAFYVTLVTFSRGVYVACAISALIWVLTYRPAEEADERAHDGGVGPGVWAGVLMLVMLYWGMWTVFRSGGYRTLVALVALVPAGHLAVLVGHRSRAGAWPLGLVFFGLFVGVEVSLFLFLDKGAYWAFAVALDLMLIALAAWWRVPTEWAAGGLLGAWGGMMVAVALVALYWGDLPAFYDCLMVEGVLALPVMFYCLRPRPLHTWHVRQTLTLTGGVAALALTVAVPGGYYMGSRFSSVEQDLALREEHWRDAFNWLDTAEDLAFGKGLGRFPETYYQNAPLQETPGVHNFHKEVGNGFLRLISAKHPLTWGDMWRVLQILPMDASGPLTFRADVRLQKDAVLYVEVCDRHLIYASACSTSHITLKAGPEGWQAVKMQLAEHKAAAGEMGMPRMRWFGMGVLSNYSLVEVDNIRLEDGSGSSLLRNGDFSTGGGYWFFSSDRDHMPWHVNNLLMSTLFDQGILGLLVFSAVCLAAVVRASARINTWPMASFFLAAFAGFLVVGLFDSLLDVPRLSMLFYLICFMLLVVQPDQFNQKKRTPRGFRESLPSPVLHESIEEHPHHPHHHHHQRRRILSIALLTIFLLIGLMTTWLDGPMQIALSYITSTGWVKILLFTIGLE